MPRTKLDVTVERIKAKKASEDAETVGKKKDERVRLWTFIAYPESLPTDWRDVLNGLHIPWIESPLHEADLNEDGGQKKPHYHILLLFDGPKSYGQIVEMIAGLNAAKPIKCHSARGLVRYMIHLDNPEKHQYRASDIIGHGGADVAEYLQPTSSSRYKRISEMRKWVAEEQCTEFFELVDYADDNRSEDWMPLLCDNSAYIMGEYIRSRRNRAKEDKELTMVTEYAAQNSLLRDEIKYLRARLLECGEC